jgi:hypothetical protein
MPAGSIHRSYSRQGREARQGWSADSLTLTFFALNSVLSRWPSSVPNGTRSDRAWRRESGTLKWTNMVIPDIQDPMGRTTPVVTRDPVFESYDVAVRW